MGKELGAGAYGAVRMAQHRDTKEIVAIKQFIELADVGSVVLAVVVLDGLRGDVRSKVVLAVRQRREFVSHDVSWEDAPRARLGRGTAHQDRTACRALKLMPL